MNQEKASLVTVSGRVKNKTRPEILYESCGFEAKVLWHILRRYEKWVSKSAVNVEM